MSTVGELHIPDVGQLCEGLTTSHGCGTHNAGALTRTFLLVGADGRPATVGTRRDGRSGFTVYHASALPDLGDDMNDRHYVDQVRVGGDAMVVKIGRWQPASMDTGLRHTAHMLPGAYVGRELRRIVGDRYVVARGIGNALLCAFWNGSGAMDEVLALGQEIVRSGDVVARLTDEALAGYFSQSQPVATPGHRP